jgi:hypothetical protein
LIAVPSRGGAGKSVDEHRRENRNYLVGANRTFDLAGSLAPIGAPLTDRGWFQLDHRHLNPRILQDRRQGQLFGKTLITIHKFAISPEASPFPHDSSTNSRTILSIRNFMTVVLVISRND